MEKTQLVSIEERKWIAEKGVIQMGSKIKYSVMNVDKVIEHMKELRGKSYSSPWIEIIPISEDLHKMPNKMPSFQKDPVTGVYYGIALNEDEYGNIKWQRLQLNDHLSLDLDKPNDAKLWSVLRFNPDIEGSPFQNQRPYYKVFDPLEESRKQNNETIQMKKAFDRVDTLLSDPKAMVNFVRYLGEDLVESSNYEIVKGRLLSAARYNPEDFNNKWQSKNRGFAEVFESARANGLVALDPDRGYVYKDISLGLTKEEAFKYLQRDATLLSSINDQLSEVDKVIINVTESIKHALKKDKSEDVTDFE
jgi:hypothetical protein